MQDLYYSTLTVHEKNYVVAATRQGLAFVGFADEPASEILRFYPQSRLHQDDAMLRPYSTEIADYLNGTLREFDLPLDIHGTIFQEAVWSALRQIPYGQTVHYQDIARAIGRPTANRAVGHAIDINPVPIVIPCHRVLPKSGGVGGYRGGSAMKAELLQLEGVII